MKSLLVPPSQELLERSTSYFNGRNGKQRVDLIRVLVKHAACTTGEAESGAWQTNIENM